LPDESRSLRFPFGKRVVFALILSRWPTSRNQEVAMSSGTGDKAKGRVKEAAGALTGDKKLKTEGKADQLAGKVKNAVEKVIDKAKDALNR
jgi:uncharacterized protein YjbJ (UPF0337 family)